MGRYLCAGSRVTCEWAVAVYLLVWNNAVHSYGIFNRVSSVCDVQVSIQMRV
jgi:hypothetical protein